MFFNEQLACFHLEGVQWVYLGDLWDKVGFQVNDVVIWVMRWESFVGFLGEDIGKVLAPLR